MGIFVTNGQAAPDGGWGDFGLRYNDSNRRVTHGECNNGSSWWLHGEATLADGTRWEREFPPNQVTQFAVPASADIRVKQDVDDPTALTYTGITRTAAWFYQP